MIIKYNEKYPNKNILWLCEQKSILTEQFDSKTLNKKGYADILKRFMVVDYTNHKPKNWYDNINSAMCWKKPILLSVNRAFLVSGKKYTKMNMEINLIMHTEFHIQ